MEPCEGSYTGEFSVKLDDVLARPDVNAPKTWAESWAALMKRLDGDH